MPWSRTIEPERPNVPKITYSERRTARAEGEGVRGCGRRAYGAASEGESTRTGLLKCLAEGGRTRQISIVMTVARSNYAPFLLLLQIFRAHCIRVGCALHGVAGAAATDIIGGIAWIHQHWKIVTLLQRNGIRVRLRYSSQKFELRFCDCHYMTLVFALQISSTITGIAASDPLGIEDATSPSPNGSRPEWICLPWIWLPCSHFFHLRRRKICWPHSRRPYRKCAIVHHPNCLVNHRWLCSAQTEKISKCNKKHRYPCRHR